MNRAPPPGRRPIRILLVDDDPVDVAFTRAALEHAGLANELSVAHDGADALARLRRAGAYADVPRPHLLLLDLEMPGMGGDELLRELQRDPTLCKLPVVVLSGSTHRRQQLATECGLLDCRFLQKPLEFKTFVRAIRSIETFGLRIVRAAS